MYILSKTFLFYQMLCCFEHALSHFEILLHFGAANGIPQLLSYTAVGKRQPQ